MRRERRWNCWYEASDGFLNLAVADAGGADADPFSGTVDNDTNALQVHVPASLGDIVGVTDPVPEHGPSSADFTYFCHLFRNSLRATQLFHSTNRPRRQATCARILSQYVVARQLTAGAGAATPPASPRWALRRGRRRTAPGSPPRSRGCLRWRPARIGARSLPRPRPHRRS